MTDSAPALLAGDESALPAAVRDALPPAEGSYALARPTAVAWARLVLDHGCRRLLEFGAGASSRLAAAALAHAGGGKLTAVEQDPTWCREHWDAARATPNIDTELIVAGRPVPRLTDHGPVFGYYPAAPALAAHRPYDAVLIDAPQGCYGRDACLWLALPHLTPGALVILDDAGRWKERLTLDRWLRTLPTAQLLDHDRSVGGSGAAVFRIPDPTHVSPALLGAASATVVFGVNAWSRWRNPQQIAA
ncbi:MAG: class I SAM-dependent methyltransferase [Planctomycetota bacterium]